MVERTFSPNDDEALKAPERLRERALAEGKSIKQIAWDAEGGYPEHAWGYVQWSLRPYEQRQGCDGTVDLNVHLIGIRLCEGLGLNYKALYEKAYEWEGDDLNTSWITDENWAEIEAETIVPDLSQKALKNLLYDLGEINNSSLIDVLEKEFTQLGYDVSFWWEDDKSVE